jgi:hypothetical protein
VNWQVLEPAYLASLRVLGLKQQPLFSFHRFFLLACTQGRMIKPAVLYVEENVPLCWVSVNIMTSEVMRVISALGALG